LCQNTPHTPAYWGRGDRDEANQYQKPINLFLNVYMSNLNNVILFYSILFYSILFYSILFYY